MLKTNNNIITNQTDQILRLRQRIQAEMVQEAKTRTAEKAAQAKAQAESDAKRAYDESPEGRAEKARQVDWLRGYLLRVVYESQNNSASDPFHRS